EEVGLTALLGPGAAAAALRRRGGLRRCREGLARHGRGILLARRGRLRRFVRRALVRRALVLRCLVLRYLRLGVRLLVPGTLLRLRRGEAVPIVRMRHGAVPVPSVFGDVRSWARRRPGTCGRCLLRLPPGSTLPRNRRWARRDRHRDAPASRG